MMILFENIQISIQYDNYLHAVSLIDFAFSLSLRLVVFIITTENFLFSLTITNRSQR